MLIDKLSTLGEISREKFDLLIMSLPQKVTSREALLLTLLNENNSMLPKEVAQAFNVTPGLITRYITSLVEKEFAVREAGDELRSYRIVITQKGIEMAQVIKAKKQSLNDEMSQKLSDKELTTFIKLIDKLTKK